jgi:hypothetical protein
MQLQRRIGYIRERLPPDPPEPGPRSPSGNRRMEILGVLALGLLLALGGFDETATGNLLAAIGFLCIGLFLICSAVFRALSGKGSPV